MMVSEHLDCDIFTAMNGNDATDILSREQGIGLILSDYKMPKANGAELFRFNSSHLNLPFFLFSGGELSDYPDLLSF